MDKPLHIVIPTHGRPDLLKRTLDSLAQCQIPAGLSQTIVIENGGQFGAEEVLKACSRRLKAVYRFTPQGNKSHALNLALENIGQGLVIFFDDDIRLDPNTLDAYANAAAEAGPNRFFGGPFGVDYEQEPPPWLLGFLPKSAKGWQVEETQRKSNTPLTFCGCNWAVFAQDLHKMGGFNPEMGPTCLAVGEETEMQIRLRAAGILPQYLEKAKVWHYVPADRCSPQWAIDRVYHTAAGMTKRKKSRSKLKLLWKEFSWRYNPKWAFRRAIVRFATDEQVRFRAAYKIARRRAVLDMMRT